MSIWIGPIIIIINNYQGPAQEPTPEPEQAAPAHIEHQTSLPEETANMVYVKCDFPECEWEGFYETQGKAGQGLGMHRSWHNRNGHGPMKKRPFGTR